MVGTPTPNHLPKITNGRVLVDCQLLQVLKIGRLPNMLPPSLRSVLESQFPLPGNQNEQAQNTPQEDCTVDCKKQNPQESADGFQSHLSI